MKRRRGTRERVWLDLDTVLQAVREARAVGVSRVAAGRGGFAAAFTRANGDPNALGVHRKTGRSWRARRNEFVARHMAQAKQNGESLWVDGAPSARHLALAVWAYSPSPTRLRRWLAEIEGSG